MGFSLAILEIGREFQDSRGEFWNSRWQFSTLAENFGILAGDFQEWQRIWEFLLVILESEREIRNSCWQISEFLPASLEILAQKFLRVVENFGILAVNFPNW